MDTRQFMYQQQIQFWAYRTVCGEIHVEPLDPEFGDLLMRDARRSETIDNVYGPFYAVNRETAEKTAEKAFEC